MATNLGAWGAEGFGIAFVHAPVAAGAAVGRVLVLAVELAHPGGLAVEEEALVTASTHDVSLATGLRLEAKMPSMCGHDPCLVMSPMHDGSGHLMCLPVLCNDFRTLRMTHVTWYARDV